MPTDIGPSDLAFIARGEQNFARFAAVLNDSLKAKAWLIGERLTIADFSVSGFVPLAERMALPVEKFPELLRWYKRACGAACLAGRSYCQRCGNEPLAARRVIKQVKKWALTASGNAPIRQDRTGA
jgi:glutathione S-transferase